jgi:3-isopropylmalate/(R)-2-methylmalate dehydratase small subunit
MERLDRVDSPALPIAIVNCDTDQILPAQYLQKLRSEDFGRFLFGQLRFRQDGSEVEDFVLNRPPYRGARILVADRNFACGSSREHAVWALYDHGFRVVIAPSFGDIFFANSLKNGLLPIVLPQEVVTAELDRLAARPGATVAIDLPEQIVRLSDGSVHPFEVNAFAKECLLSGLDELGYTLAQADEIDAFEAGHDEAGRAPVDGTTEGRAT